MAPLGMRPAVGTPCETFSAWPGGVEAGHGDGALRAGAGLAVGAGELRQQQRAAHQRGGVAERGDGDVEPLAGVGAQRHVGGDDHGRDVLVAQRIAAHRQAHAVEHGLQRLIGERRVAQGIAGALQADDEAVADELRVARAAQRGHVLDAHAGDARRRGAPTSSKQSEQGAPHPPLTTTRPSERDPARDRDAGIVVAHLDRLPDDAVLQRVAGGGDGEAAVDIDHLHRRRRRARSARRAERRERDRAGPAAACAPPPCRRRPPRASATGPPWRRRGERSVGQHVLADDVAGIDDVLRRGRAHLLARAPGRRREQGGARRMLRRSAHQLRMLEMVPDIWSAAWITLEFIS